MTDALYAVMIQITSDSLLLPNAAVSEVTALDRFEPAAEGAPAWLSGWHATAERRIPVLSFEALCGNPRPETTAVSPLYQIGREIAEFRLPNADLKTGEPDSSSVG